MPERVTVFAPATIANVGPGFDVLGIAVQGLGDTVTATRRTTPGVVIEAIEGDNGRLPRDAHRNTAGVAAQAVLRLAQREATGVALTIRKGLPLGSGLGSSAASAAAAAWATNLLLGEPLSRHEVLLACLEAEAAVSGWHADNVGPALFGGAFIVRTYEPLDVVTLPLPDSLVIVLVTPDYELPTAEARTVVPQTISLAQHIVNSGNLAALIAGLCRGDATLVGRAVNDVIVEPSRAHLIPGFGAVKAAALAAGAFGCSISGAGPTLFAFTDTIQQGATIAAAMQAAFAEHGISSRALVTNGCNEGACVVERP
ncbi:homoserine kinase [Ardenticatena maritima]|uniref:Homoserine kinase n=1 Tax=Ardenticatena maritima TaxID=872965 RepID=A0A0P6Y3J6_9CHLR|nr:homoserine kinase [Ardenticatena maritima]KPL86462.1 hypothetical protein SE16_14360 [Ardenticatena maritima]